MNSLTPFDFEGVSVRVIVRAGDPWWVLADVCRVLEIGNPSDAARRLDDDEKMTLDTVEGGNINGLGAVGAMPTIINESGLYSLILTSRKPEAKRFKKWVTGDVLPAIRKTGSYSAGPAIDPMAVLNDPAAMRGLLLTYTEKVIARHRPKRPAKPAQAAEIKVPRIVQHTPRGRARKPLPPNPEADARIAAFFKRMIRPG